MTAQSNSNMTVAASALNLLQNTPVSPRSIWAAMKSRAVKAEENVLEFADGSRLRFIPQSAGYLAS